MVVQAPDQDASGIPPLKGVPGVSILASGVVLLEGLHILPGLEAPSGPPGGTGKHCWVEGGLELIVEPAAAMTRPQISRGTWMNG